VGPQAFGWARRGAKSVQEPGTASYYDVVVDGERNVDAARYYPHPSAAAAEIEDHVAFRYDVDVSRTTQI
jgi:uncharacterized protein (DUF427 family)